MSEEQIFLHVGGPVPGIPGDHGPGAYLVDYSARTIRPVPAAPEPGINVAQSEPQATPVEPLPLSEIVAEVAQLEQQVQALEQPQ